MSEDRPGFVRASGIIASIIVILLVLTGASIARWTAQRAALASASLTVNRYDRYCRHEVWSHDTLLWNLRHVLGPSDQDGLTHAFGALESRAWRSTTICIPDGIVLGRNACDGDIRCMEVATTKAIFFMGLGH